MRKLALLLLAGLLAPARGAQPPAPLVLNSLGSATAPVSGIWQFHTGDDPAWASPSLDDSKWQPIEVGRPWEGQGHRSLTGFAWYRRHIVLSPRGAADWQIALLIPNVQNAAEVYWNGRLVGSYGKLPPHPVWFQDGLDLTYLLGKPQSGVLAIRIWKAPYIFFSNEDEGGLVDTPRIGSAEAIAALAATHHNAMLSSSLYGLGLALLSGIVALLAVLAWLRDRRQWMLFWLALYTLHPLALLPITGVPGATGIPGALSFHWSYGLVAPIISIEDVSLWFLLIYLLGLRDNRRLVQWTAAMAAVAVLFNALDGSLQLFDWTRWPGHLFLVCDIAFTIPALLVEAYGLVLIVFALRKRLDAARWILAITALAADLIQATGNWSGLGERWTHWTLYERLDAPLFTIGGSEFALLTVANSLLLIAILYAAWRYSVEQSQRQIALEQEYRSARELQQILIPESLPALPGFHLASVYRPAQEVGGDFFQVIALPGDESLLIIGDVSGKGLHAAMTVSLIVGAIRSTVEATSQPAEVLNALNRRLYGRLRYGFATCLVLRVRAGGDCEVANAGHLPPLVDGQEMELPSALPLGLTPDAEYESAALHLAPGDRLMLYTDGVLEARNASGELFGFERTRAVSTQSAEDIALAAQQFGQEDDITVLTLQFAPAEVLLA